VRLLGIFVVVSALVSPGAEFAVARDAPANDFSALLEWRIDRRLHKIHSNPTSNTFAAPRNAISPRVKVAPFDLKGNRGEEWR
jgi:hypothetical protein